MSAGQADASVAKGSVTPARQVSTPASGLSGARATARTLPIIYAVTFIIVFLMVALPVGALIGGSFRTAAPGLPGDWTLRNYAGLLSHGVLVTAATTLWVSLLSSAFCIIIGTALALIIHRTDFRHPRLFARLLELAFYFPSIVIAMAWIIIGSPGGLFNGIVDGIFGLSWLRVDIYNAGGILLVMVLHQVPFVYLTMRSPIMGMDSVYEEAARASGATPPVVLARVTIPLLSYSLISSFILAFVLAIEQFAIPAMVGIPGHVNMLATQLYLLVSFSPADYGLAAAIGIALSILTGVAIWAQRRVAGAGRLVTVTGKGNRLKLIALGKWRWAANLFCGTFVCLGLFLPMVILIYTSLLKFFNGNPFTAAYTLRNYDFIWNSDAILRSFWNAFIASGVGGALGVLLGVLCAYFTTRARMPGHHLLDFLVTMPFGVPGVVLGLGLLWAYAYLPLPLYGTLALIIIAFVTRYLPYSAETIGGQMVQIDRSLEEAAWVSGATRSQGVAKILVPLVRPALRSAYFLLFMAFFREVSTVILIYSSSSAVVSISIWAFFEQAQWGLASALAIVATVIIFVAMSLIERLAPFTRRAV